MIAFSILHFLITLFHRFIGNQRRRERRKTDFLFQSEKISSLEKHRARIARAYTITRGDSKKSFKKIKPTLSTERNPT